MASLREAPASYQGRVRLTIAQPQMELAQEDATSRSHAKWRTRQNQAAIIMMVILGRPGSRKSAH
ncbi:hypothetical protein A8G00_03110 [Sphingobium sp. SA916]|nr:hypothetical protein A8G00_03110 [Sphingobium sp. SA916]